MTSRIRQSVPDLARVRFSVDLGAVNLAEGVRAGLSVAAIVAASAWLHWPSLVLAGLAALFACLCDMGGPVRRRVPALLSFTILAAIMGVLGGLARHVGFGAALPLSVFVIFCGAFVRIYGQQAQQVGMFLPVILVLSLDHAAPDLGVALETGGLYLAGGLWATALTLVLWRVHPFRPIRRALAASYAALAAMTKDLQGLLQKDVHDNAAWEFHARLHRRSVRTAIEEARAMILDTVRSRGPASQRATQSLLRLETGDQLFGALIALSDLLETATAAERAAVAHMIRRLRPLLVVLGHEMLEDRTDAHVQINRSIAAMERDIAVLPEGNGLRELASLIVARLRVVLTVSATAGQPIDAGPGEQFGGMWSRAQMRRRYQSLRSPLLANLDWTSIPFRHALRAAVTAAPAMAYTLIHNGPYDHWLTITIIVTMQPYFGNTFTRALERAGGTTLGGLLAAGLALLVSTPMHSTLLMFPLTVLTFALRSVSFGLFISGLTPVIVLLVELGQPDTSGWMIALTRVLLTVAGGLTAVAGCYLLWPSWEPNRLVDEVRAAIVAHGRYAAAEFSLILKEAGQIDVEQARRSAGLATNNVEALVARALLEPGQAHNDRLEAAMVIDAALRRFAGRLAAMQFDPEQADALSPDAWRAWRDWISASMQQLGSGESLAGPHPIVSNIQHTEALGRIARQIELIGGTIDRIRG